MAHPDDLVVALARAYGLSELVDLDGDRLRRKLEAARERLDGSSAVVVRVRFSDLETGGGPVEDPDGFVAEMARDLSFAGVREIHIPGDASLESLLAFVRGLRAGAGSGRPDETGAAFADELPEIGVAFEDEGAGGGAEREMGGLFGGRERERAVGEPGPGGPEPPSAEAAPPPAPDGEEGPGEEPPVEEAVPDAAPGAPREGAGPAAAGDAPGPGTAAEPEAPSEPEADAGAAARAGEPGEEGDPAKPTGEGGEPEARPDPLVELAERYLQADAVGRRELAARIRRHAEEASEPAEVGSVAAAVERIALEAAGDSGQPEWTELARELTNPGVAARLALRLGGIRDEEGRGEEIRALALLGEEMAAAVGEALMDTSDRAARRAYIEALVAMGEAGIARAEAMIEDDRWFVVRNGVSILGEAGGERAIEHLTSALGHDDPRVRREAVMALARVGGEDAGALLLGLVDDPDPEVREATARALGHLKVERAIRPLLQRLDQEDEEDVEVQIIRALGALGDPGAVPAIEKRAVASFFSRPSQPLRIAAYKALSDIGTPHAMGLVESAAEDKDSEIRDLAREILAAR